MKTEDLMTTETPAPRRRTDALAHRLAQEAGRGLPRRLSFAAALPAAAAAAILAAFGVVLALVGPRPDFPFIIGEWIYLFKATAMLLLAGGSYGLVRAAAIPGRSVKPALALAPAALFLLVNALADRSGLPLSGVRPPFSVPLCVGMIVVASLPALALFLAAMRRGAPTRLRRAGFFAGLLAGATGALGYTAACVNDGAAFVGVWYVVAALIVAGIGAAAGPRSLAW